MSEIFNHLWQSTTFAAAIAVACLALRRNSPRSRYWLWLAASLKFLIPFSLFVSMGTRIKVPPNTPALHAVTVQEISTYFAPVSILPGPATRRTFAWSACSGAIWFTGAIFLLLRWMRQWHTIYLGRPRRNAIAARVCLANLLFLCDDGAGVFRYLSPDDSFAGRHRRQVDGRTVCSYLAHELRHVRCSDNLTAALHMCVETLFWFHPVVWWIGARLTGERERDCDEAVLRLGNRPADYARSIVHVCEAYIELPLACASGNQRL